MNKRQKVLYITPKDPVFKEPFTDSQQNEIRSKYADYDWFFMTEHPKDDDGRLDTDKLLHDMRHLVEEKNITITVAEGDLASILQTVLKQECPTLRGPSLESVFLCNHKVCTREVLLHKTMNIPFMPINVKDDFHQIAEKVKTSLGFPIVMKPCIDVLSSMMKIVFNEDSLFDTLSKFNKVSVTEDVHAYIFEKFISAKKYPLVKQPVVIAEDFICDATNHTIECFVQDGKVIPWTISDSIFWPNSPTIYYGMGCPSLLKPQIQSALWDMTIWVGERMIKYGFKDQFFNMEIFVRKNGDFRVLEINPRLSNTQCEQYREIFGKSNRQALLEILQGKKCQTPKHLQKRYSVTFFLISLAKGNTSDIVNYPALPSFPNVHLKVPEGVYVEPMADGGVMYGTALVSGEDFADCHRQIKSLRLELFKDKPEDNPFEDFHIEDHVLWKGKL